MHRVEFDVAGCRDDRGAHLLVDREDAAMFEVRAKAGKVSLGQARLFGVKSQRRVHARKLPRKPVVLPATFPLVGHREE